MDNEGQINSKKSLNRKADIAAYDNIVLEKTIFSNIFEKDIRRVYVYKKAERLARSLTLIAPAFKDTKTLRERMNKLSVDLIDASLLPPREGKDALSRELLSLLSLLSMARSSSIISHMNAEIIMRETHLMLQEIASYEEPHLSLGDLPNYASFNKTIHEPQRTQSVSVTLVKENKGQTVSVRKPIAVKKNERRSHVLSVLKDKGPSDIKQLSSLMRDISEKTIQRELQALVLDGLVQRTGERRWTRYALAG